MTDGSGFVGRYNGSGSTWGRKDSDFYPTPPDVTVALLEFLKFSTPRRIWEPACGAGDMAWVLEQAGHDVVATDLNDTGYGESGKDFLDPDFDLALPDVAFRVDAIITNPPFAKAFEFAQTAVCRAPLVALLFKSSYWHASTRLPFFRAHPPSCVLPLTWRPSFLEEERGKSPFMDVLWTVWAPNTLQTRYVPLARPSMNIGKPPLAVHLARLNGAAKEALDVRSP